MAVLGTGDELMSFLSIRAQTKQGIVVAGWGKKGQAVRAHLGTALEGQFGPDAVDELHDARAELFYDLGPLLQHVPDPDALREAAGLFGRAGSCNVIALGDFVAGGVEQEDYNGRK
jgi:hypothetical protein